MDRDNSLRVCLLNDSFPPVIDGVSNAVLNYARVLSAHGEEPVVATPQVPGSRDDYPFPVFRYPSLDTTKLVGYRTGLPFSPELLRELEWSQPQIIHSHCPIISTLLARTLRESTGAPIVFTYHTKFDVDIKNSISSGFLQEAARRSIIANIEACDEVWTVSRGAGENLRSLGFRGEYRVMHNGVDFVRGPAPKEAVNAVSREYGLPDGVPVFLYVGRMMWYKNLGLTLDALRLLQRDGMDFRMLFVGGGQDAREVAAKAEKLGLSGRCIFTGPVRDREKLRALFSRAQLFLFPSTFDTNGIVVREAAACALASVLVRGSCAAEDVEEGRNALLIREDAADMARVISEVCRDPEAVRALGQRALEELYLSWDEAVSRAEERYGLLLEQTRSRGLSHSEAPGNELFRYLSEALNAVERVRSARSDVVELIGRLGSRHA